MTTTMHRLHRQGQLLSASIRIANTFVSRLRGLLFSRPLLPGSGLLLMRCNSIHMFFMTYAIDCAFLDGDLKILVLHRNVRPWRLAFCGDAAHVLELGAGSIDAWDLRIGQRLELL